RRLNILSRISDKSKCDCPVRIPKNSEQDVFKEISNVEFSLFLARKHIKNVGAVSSLVFFKQIV
ncbi:hypothetical protein, partial [Porphyromonas gingivalis]